jgi:hypothetical protein
MEDCFIICSDIPSIGDGILASRIPPDQIEPVTEILGGTAARAERRVIMTPLKRALATVYNAMKPLAKELRGDKLTDELRIHKRGSNERKAAGVALKEKMQVHI